MKLKSDFSSQGSPGLTCLYTQAPPEDKIVMQGLLSKRCVAKKVYWAQRFVTLTTERLYLANEKDGEVRDELR